jgi:hypothetical protein
MTSTDTDIDIPANPAGWVGPWEPPALTGLPDTVRYFDGQTRVVEVAGDLDVPTSYQVHITTQGAQYPDGRLDQKKIRVDGVCSDAPLTVEQARKLAAALLQAADEAQGWAQQATARRK